MEPQSKPKRDIIRLDLAFITPFWADADATPREEIFHDIFFPFLLYSKSGQKRANIVWEIINQTLLADATSSLSEWLAGCTDIIAKAASGSGDGDSVELLNGINFDLAEKIAGKQTPPIFYPFY
jgi:U3 small nucleolar RNA-associated protein 10